MKKLVAVCAATSILVGCSTVHHSPLPEPETKVANPSPRVSLMVFFDWDSTELPSNIVDILSPHVVYLLNHPDQKILIEGAADETGDEQYNFALGLRRAQKVKHAFEAQGISSRQLIVRSIGINRPLNQRTCNNRRC